MAETNLGSVAGHGQNVKHRSANVQNGFRTNTVDIAGDIITTGRFIDGSAAIVGGSGHTAGTNGILSHPAINNNVIAPHAATNAASVITAGVHTYTIDEVMSGHILRDCFGASRTDTLCTGTIFGAVLTAVGDTAHVSIANVSDAAEVLTVNAGAGGTMIQNTTGGSSKTITLNRNDAGYVMIRMTGAATYDLFLLAGGTHT